MKLHTSDQTRHPDDGYDPDRVAEYRREMRTVERTYRLSQAKRRRAASAAP